MDLLKLLRSFEEFLFEVMTWLFFYPRTLARIVMGPLRMMAYADDEAAQPEEQRFDDALSPPVLLLITLVLANLIAWAAHVPRPAGTSQLTHELFDSQQHLLLFRCLVFSMIPLVAALTLLRRQRAVISRQSLRLPFYAQCYLAAPSALVVSLGLIGVQRPQPIAIVTGLALIALATLWLLTAQTRWFRDRLGIGWAAAAGTAVWAYARSMVFLALIIVPVALV